MWRYFVGAGAAVLLAVAGMFLFQGSAAPERALPSAPRSAAASADPPPLPDEAPRATERTREQKRFDRYDKDRNQQVAREEYLLSRRKAFARLDTNRDGQLGFDEWAAKTLGKFAAADRDKSGALDRPEFLATAPKARAARPKCACPARGGAKEEGDD